MGVEIERKFLVKKDALPELKNGRMISQGYIQTSDHTVVRARVKGDKGYLTIKGKSDGMRCAEYEYEIPVTDACEIISNLCNGKCVEKTRYEIKIAKHIWEVDVFHGENEGLIVAEVELAQENEEVDIPTWVAEEVTGQTQYFNASLLHHPYKKW